jgi:hypothetical protein
MLPRAQAHADACISAPKVLLSLKEEHFSFDY